MCCRGVNATCNLKRLKFVEFLVGSSLDEAGFFSFPTEALNAIKQNPRLYKKSIILYFYFAVRICSYKCSRSGISLAMSCVPWDRPCGSWGGEPLAPPNLPLGVC